MTRLYPAVAQSRGSEKLVLVCGDSKVLLVDYAKSRDTIPEVVWSWDAHVAQDLPEEVRSKKFNGIDDSKAVNKGRQIIVSSSSGGGVVVLNKKDKKVLFYHAVPNAHSVTVLPRNRLVAAASTAPEGNRIILFDMRHPEMPLFSDSLYSAHGLVWHDKRKSLYALGYNVLREYKSDSFASLRLVNEWKIPGIGGHDLTLSPDGKRLFLTEHNGSWAFDLSDHQFTKPEGMPDYPNMKSIGQLPSGQYVLTVPEESWWTYHVRFSNPARKLAFPGHRVYKARWFGQ